MKTIYKTLIIFFMLLISVYPGDRKVLVEIFTNSQCPLCPSAHNTIDNYLQNSPNADKITYIYYNIRYPYITDQLYQYNTTDSDAKYKLYLNSSGGNPAAFFDGKYYTNSYSSWGNTLDNLETKPSSFDLMLNGNYTSSDFTVNAEITKTDETMDEDLTVNFVVVEDVEYSGGNGITNHRHVMRKIANIDGDPLTIEINEAKEKSSTFDIDDIWNQSNLGVVVFIQSKSTKTVYQSAYINYTDLSPVTGVEPENHTPSQYTLAQNYPNPFNPATKIKYYLPEESFVKLEIYNILGKEISALVNKNQQAGSYEYTFNAGSLPSGIYFYRLTAFNKEGKQTVQTKKMTLIK